MAPLVAARTPHPGPPGQTKGSTAVDHTPPARQVAGESSRAAAVVPAAIHRATRGPRPDSCVRFPLSSAELINGGVCPQRLTSLALLVPAPQFPRKTPAGRGPSTPVPYSAPGGQPVPRHPHEASSVEHQLQPARLPVRSPGQHMHPQLRRLPGVGASERAVRSA
ncbi:MAG: hypothetical protein M3Y48_01195 [Actinomycetota bacterium]|nr:hypothetical protein [Actinomycetota bacterium]